MSRLIVILFFIVFTGNALAQVDTSRVVSTKKLSALDSLSTKDSLLAVQDTSKKETRKERKEREKAEKEREKYYYKNIKKDSTRLAIEEVSRVAWKRSAIAPGWGQITNGGKWLWVKLPVIYGGFVTAYFVFDYWNWYYRKFVDEAAYRMDNGNDKKDPDLFGYESVEGLIQAKDNFRRNRDMTVLVTAVWWAGNVVEAYTDSMLKNRYNIGDDLSIKINPTLMPSGTMAYQPNFKNQFAPGVKLTFILK